MDFILCAGCYKIPYRVDFNIADGSGFRLPGGKHGSGRSFADGKIKIIGVMMKIIFKKTTIILCALLYAAFVFAQVPDTETMYGIMDKAFLTTTFWKTLPVPFR